MAIDRRAHERQGKAITNFSDLLPSPQSDLAVQALKDPYLFDFLTLEEPFHEHELETELVQHLEKFLLELGQGFAFVGRQYRLDVGDEDFYIDLLFYHLRLRSFVVIDLKTGPFKPEYAGKLNFYCNVVNDKLRHAMDKPTIGLILCQTKDRVLAEYALSGIDKPIGVSSYELTRALPARLKSVLPTVEEIEAELAATDVKQTKPRTLPRPKRGRGLRRSPSDHVPGRNHERNVAATDSWRLCRRVAWHQLRQGLPAYPDLQRSPAHPSRVMRAKLPARACLVRTPHPHDLTGHSTPLVSITRSKAAVVS